MTPEEKQEFNNMKEILNKLMKSDRYVFERDVEMATGRAILIGKDGFIKQNHSDGFMINTDTTGKLGFNGYTPIVRPTTTAASGGSTIDSEARDWIADLHNGLSNYGLFEAL